MFQALELRNYVGLDAAKLHVALNCLRMFMNLSGLATIQSSLERQWLT